MHVGEVTHITAVTLETGKDNAGRPRVKDRPELCVDDTLIDLQLGEESGAQLLRQLKNHANLARTAFICFTGTDESEIDWRTLGFNGFCQKPISLDALEKL